MLHTKIQNEDVIERYVRDRLTAEERSAFEEHFFNCDECFRRVQETESFLAGMRDAAVRGILPDREGSLGEPYAPAWLRWAFPASGCAVVILGFALGWITFHRLPGMEAELDQTAARVRNQQQEIAELKQRPGSTDTAEANIPLVMLEASRGDRVSPALLAPDARHLILWAEPGSARFTSYRMEVFSPGGELVATIDHLTRGPYGAVAASLPAAQLHPGIYRITLSGQAPLPAALVGEYRISIRRP